MTQQIHGIRSEPLLLRGDLQTQPQPSAAFTFPDAWALLCVTSLIWAYILAFILSFSSHGYQRANRCLPSGTGHFQTANPKWMRAANIAISSHNSQAHCSFRWPYLHARPWNSINARFIQKHNKHYISKSDLVREANLGPIFQGTTPSIVLFSPKGT